MRHSNAIGISALIATLCLGASIPSAYSAASGTLNIDLTNPGPVIPPTFYGLMTEEINHSYDGGLFAELIQNRTFQDPGQGSDGAPVHWSVVGPGKASISNSDPVNTALPVSLRLELTGQMAGIANDGYWGIPIRPNTTYTATFYAKASDGFEGPVTASLLTDSGNVTLAKADTQAVTGKWKKYTLTLTTPPNAPTTAEARFVLSANGNGSVHFSFVSLFPPTYKNTANGLRPDLMKLMADMRPAFIRLPGGNYVEGGRFSDRFNWKQMIGPADQRPGHMGCWGYRSSDGFGLPEYLLWCKQLGAEPVLAVFAGYVLNGDHVNAGSPEMAIYTEEALQEIEYVSGPATSEWGHRRAADGFPEPFPLHYVEIGNEDWFDKSPSYDGRFTQIAKAIRAKYPQLKLIATAPVTSFKPDLYDDHLYAGARTMMEQWNHYDKSTAPAPLTHAGGGWSGRQSGETKTFVGEWASQEGRPTPNLKGALGDAVYLMGLERNGDAISMECYAPLLANVNPENRSKGQPRGWQWETNLIGYDALHSFGSPSYYVQATFAQNKGDVVLPTTFDTPSTVKELDPAPHGCVGVGSYRTQVEYKDIEVTTPDGTKISVDNFADAKNWQLTNGEWSFDNGTLKPRGDLPSTWAIAGDPTWNNYTIHLRARKLGGEEGFLVLWHAADGDNYHWWNVGGWGNTTTRCEVAEDGTRNGYGPGSPFAVETGRWYDLRLEVNGNTIRGFIDNQLVTEAAEEPRPATVSAYASASYINSSKEVIVKVVNPGQDSLESEINLRGAGKVDPKGTAIVITGALNAVNTVDSPTNVAPKQEAFTDASASFKRTFPPHSVTLLRLSAKK